VHLKCVQHCIAKLLNISGIVCQHGKPCLLLAKKKKVIDQQDHTISKQGTNESGIVEIKNVPTQLILFAIMQWQQCGKHLKKKQVGYNTNNFLKQISVWLILKNETTSGCIKSYRSQLPQLAEKCKMSVRTLEARINALRTEGLAFVNEKTLYLRDYKVLRRYGIKIDEREQTISYDTTDTVTLAEKLITIGIARLKERWMKMYWMKVNNNPDEYKALYDLFIKNGADASKLNSPEYFRQTHLEALCQSFNEETPGQPYYQFLHYQINANPDLNARADTYAFKFGYAAAMSFCHLKYRLVKKGLLLCEKDNIDGTRRARKDDKVFRVKWAKQSKTTIWFRPDQLTVLTNKIFSNDQPKTTAA
jgi:hypothetical protein